MRVSASCPSSVYNVLVMASTWLYSSYFVSFSFCFISDYMHFFSFVFFAANFVLLPYYTFNYLVSSSGDGSRSPLAEISLLVLLILIHYRKRINVDESTANNGLEDCDSHAYLKENPYFCDNPYCKALENARDIECKKLPSCLNCLLV